MHMEFLVTINLQYPDVPTPLIITSASIVKGVTRLREVVAIKDEVKKHPLKHKISETYCSYRLAKCPFSGTI